MRSVKRNALVYDSLVLARGGHVATGMRPTGNSADIVVLHTAPILSEMRFVKRDALVYASVVLARVRSRLHWA